MSLERVLDTPLLQLIRSATATVRAVTFVLGILAAAAVATYAFAIRPLLDSTETAGITVATISLLPTLLLGLYLMGYRDAPAYRIEELEAIMEVKPTDGHHAYDYTRRQTVRSVRSNLRLIDMGAHWTGCFGPDKVSIEALSHAHCILDTGRSEEDGRVHRWVYPGGPLSRGATTQVGIRQTMEDDLKPMLSYFREGGGRHRTRNLRVVVRFPSGAEPSRVEGLEWNTNRNAHKGNVVGRLQCVREYDQKAGVVQYSVAVPRPRLFHSYGMRWEW